MLVVSLLEDQVISTNAVLLFACLTSKRFHSQAK